MQHPEMIIVTDSQGRQTKMELIDVVHVEQNEYVIVGPINSNEAYAYKAIKENGETQYESIGNGEEFQRVLQKYNEQQ